MKKKIISSRILILIILLLFQTSFIWADGGYFSGTVTSISRSRKVAISADQRAILIKNGDEISMTFSTGYTGDGEDFGWIIPTPVPPAIEDVIESGKSMERAFVRLDKYTAPAITTVTIYGRSGCFPAGTEVLTAGGPRAIETVEPGEEVYVCDLATGEWVLARVFIRESYDYEGDMVTIHMGQEVIRATGNHPFFVIRGDRLALRPPPQDVPEEEQGMTGGGRWVEARDLRVGDVLKDKGGEGVIITGLSSRHEKMEVYNLRVEGYHNYSVLQRGILVHNMKMGGDEGEATTGESKRVVSVYGKVTLKHYEVSILGAADASALMGWLQKNGYQVNPEADEVLNTYIKQNWAFVAVKLNPGKKRHYENEFLPPLTIRYRYDHLIYPMRLSSISTTQTAKITLYVIAESTARSSNFPTTRLRYDRIIVRGGA